MLIYKVIIVPLGEYFSLFLLVVFFYIKKYMLNDLKMFIMNLLRLQGRNYYFKANILLDSFTYKSYKQYFDNPKNYDPRGVLIQFVQKGFAIFYYVNIKIRVKEDTQFIRKCKFILKLIVNLIGFVLFIKPVLLFMEFVGRLIYNQLIKNKTKFSELLFAKIKFYFLLIGYIYAKIKNVTYGLLGQYIYIQFCIPLFLCVRLLSYLRVKLDLKEILIKIVDILTLKMKLKRIFFLLKYYIKFILYYIWSIFLSVLSLFIGFFIEFPYICGILTFKKRTRMVYKLFFENTLSGLLFEFIVEFVSDLFCIFFGPFVLAKKNIKNISLYIFKYVKTNVFNVFFFPVRNYVKLIYEDIIKFYCFKIFARIKENIQMIIVKIVEKKNKLDTYIINGRKESKKKKIEMEFNNKKERVKKGASYRYIVEKQIDKFFIKLRIYLLNRKYTQIKDLMKQIPLNMLNSTFFKKYFEKFLYDETYDKDKEKKEYYNVKTLKDYVTNLKKCDKKEGSKLTYKNLQSNKEFITLFTKVFYDKSMFSNFLIGYRNIILVFNSGYIRTSMYDMFNFKIIEHIIHERSKVLKNIEERQKQKKKDKRDMNDFIEKYEQKTAVFLFKDSNKLDDYLPLIDNYEKKLEYIRIGNKNVGGIYKDMDSVRNNFSEDSLGKVVRYLQLISERQVFKTYKLSKQLGYIYFNMVNPYFGEFMLDFTYDKVLEDKIRVSSMNRKIREKYENLLKKRKDYMKKKNKDMKKKQRRREIEFRMHMPSFADEDAEKQTKESRLNDYGRIFVKREQKAFGLKYGEKEDKEDYHQLENMLEENMEGFDFMYRLGKHFEMESFLLKIEHKCREKLFLMEDIKEFRTGEGSTAGKGIDMHGGDFFGLRRDVLNRMNKGVGLILGGLYDGSDIHIERFENVGKDKKKKIIEKQYVKDLLGEAKIRREEDSKAKINDLIGEDGTKFRKRMYEKEEGLHGLVNYRLKMIRELKQEDLAAKYMQLKMKGLDYLDLTSKNMKNLFKDLEEKYINFNPNDNIVLKRYVERGNDATKAVTPLGSDFMSKELIKSIKGVKGLKYLNMKKVMDVYFEGKDYKVMRGINKAVNKIRGNDNYLHNHIFGYELENRFNYLAKPLFYAVYNNFMLKYNKDIKEGVNKYILFYEGDIMINVHIYLERKFKWINYEFLEFYNKLYGKEKKNSSTFEMQKRVYFGDSFINNYVNTMENNLMESFIMDIQLWFLYLNIKLGKMCGKFVKYIVLKSVLILLMPLLCIKSILLQINIKKNISIGKCLMFIYFGFLICVAFIRFIENNILGRGKMIKEFLDKLFINFIDMIKYIKGFIIHYVVKRDKFVKLYKYKKESYIKEVMWENLLNEAKNKERNTNEKRFSFWNRITSLIYMIKYLIDLLVDMEEKKKEEEFEEVEEDEEEVK